MRVVLDTNVLVSAFISPEGSPGKIWKKWQSRRFTLVLSQYIVAEFRRALVDKLGLDANFVDERIQAFHQLAFFVEPTEVALEVEANDWPIIGTAVAGAADVLVSGDKRVLSLKQYHGIDIVSPKKFLEFLQ